jgi:shikimate dehydrogenase
MSAAHDTSLPAINGATRVVGIIGDPVAHSLSPAIHNAAFAALQINMIYVPLPTRAEHVAEAVSGLRALGFRGANVTMPHKTAVIPSLDVLADDARLIEAVNTIVVEGEVLHGFNTDIAGFLRALREVVPEAPAGMRVLLLGAGGAAGGGGGPGGGGGAPPAAERLVALLRPAYPRPAYHTVALSQLTPAIVNDAQLIVNATSLGMDEVAGGEAVAGGGPDEPLKVPAVLVDTLRRDHIVYDVVYRKRPTLLLTKARAVGARTVDGLSMLVWQAAAAFELWTGAAAPLDVMRGAARRGP